MSITNRFGNQGKKEQIVNEKEVLLSNKEVFDLFIGPRKLKKDYVESKGDIPVYSANVFEPFVYSEDSNIEDFQHNYVIWGIDGNFKFNYMLKGEKFATTDHCGAIKILNEKINPLFVAYTLEQNKHLYGFDRGLRASLTNMKKVSINVPVDKNGEFDYKIQEDIAAVLSCIEQMKAILVDKCVNLKNINIRFIDEAYEFKYIALPSLLKRVKGKSKYTKKYGQLNKGKYPVYSASSSSPLAYIDTYDYDGEFLSWSTNGFAGTISVFDEKFSINGDRGLLLPKDDRKDLDLYYLKYVLEPMFREMAKGRKGDNGVDEFTKLYPSMLEEIMIPMPIDENGEISLALQKEIAQKYKTIFETTNDVISNIRRVVEQRINI